MHPSNNGGSSHAGRAFLDKSRLPSYCDTGVPDLAPSVCAVLQLGDDALEVLLTGEPIELNASPLNVPGVQHG